MSDFKSQAEALVLFANNIDGLLTCALRPSNVFGPGDTQLVPLLVNLAKSGWAKVWYNFCKPLYQLFFHSHYFDHFGNSLNHVCQHLE